MVISPVLPVNNFSQTSIVTSVTSLDESYSKQTRPKRPLKLHSADLPYLQILLWCYSKEGFCYLTKEQWPQWLVDFGGKAIDYRKQKARWAKMRALKYIVTKYSNGNRNKEFEHYITQAGIEAVGNFLLANSKKQKTAPRKTKNGPSKIEKSKKTAPPLTHASTLKDKHEKAIERLQKNDPEKAQTYRYLADFGFYPAVAVEMMKKYSRLQIYQAYTKTKERRPRNPGAYMMKMLSLELK